MAAKIRTITGDIAPSQALAALTHEHFFCYFLHDPPLSRPRLAELEKLLERDLRRLRAADCNLLVDAATLKGYVRPMEMYRRLSERTGVYVVACTGAYLEHAIPRTLRRRSVDELAVFMRNEIEEGIDQTAIKAGIIKLASGSPVTMATHERRCFDAAVLVYRAIGVPLTCHSHLSIAFQAEYFKKAGVAPKKVTLGHPESNPWFDIRTAARLGFMLSFTNLGGDLFRIPEAVILAQVESLVRLGHARQIMLAHDFTYRITRGKLTPDWAARYDYILRQVVPKLRKLGLSHRVADQIIHENPRRALAY